MPVRELRPTLWRTCRALANRRRLLLLHDLLWHPPMGVSELAKRGKISLSCASQHLRRLNARGVLTAMRTGREVLYRVQPDPLVPGADALLEALRQLLRRKGPRIQAAHRALTTFTHPRRIKIYRILHAGPSRTSVVARTCGMSRAAAERHLAKMHSRGVAVSQAGRWRRGRPSDPLTAVLVELALLSPD